MGRKKLDDARKPFTAMIKRRSREDIRELADLLDMTESAIGSHLINMGIGVMEDIEKTGLIKIVCNRRVLARTIHRKFVRGEEITLKDIIEDE